MSPIRKVVQRGTGSRPTQQPLPEIEPGPRRPPLPRPKKRRAKQPVAYSGQAPLPGLEPDALSTASEVDTAMREELNHTLMLDVPEDTPETRPCSDA